MSVCDCCGREREVSRVWVFGIETYACDECRGEAEEEEDDAMSKDNPWGEPVGPPICLPDQSMPKGTLPDLEFRNRFHKFMEEMQRDYKWDEMHWFELRTGVMWEYLAVTYKEAGINKAGFMRLGEIIAKGVWK